MMVVGSLLCVVETRGGTPISASLRIVFEKIRNVKESCIMHIPPLSFHHEIWVCLKLCGPVCEI